MEGKVPDCIKKINDKITLTVRAKPGAKKEGVSYIDDDSVEIAVHAQAQNNKANLAIINYLADIFDVSKSCVKLEVGGTSRNKVISISKDITVEEAYEILKDNSI